MNTGYKALTNRFEIKNKMRVLINRLTKEELEKVIIGLLIKDLDGIEDVAEIEAIVNAFDFAFNTHRKKYSEKEHLDLCKKMNSIDKTHRMEKELIKKLAA